MTEQEFIENVVKKDRAWHAGKARLYKRLHLATRITVIIISATIAFCSGQQFEYKDLTIGILSGFILVITAISELVKFKDNWIENRFTSELMKKELIYFETATEPYNNPETRFHLFVKNLEKIKEHEREKWTSIADQK